jgi:RNA polymerase sigma-70 factor (ECF subfamily)
LNRDNRELTGNDRSVPDAELAKARAGDSSAFAALVRAHQRSVYSLALRMLGGHELAEDLSQEVFLRLHRHLAGIESPAHLTFWLRQVTVNRAIDRLRQPRLETASLEEAGDVPMQLAEPDPLLDRHLANLLRALPPAARAVLLLRYQEDLDPVDIARALDLSINTVKSHLKRSLAALRAKMSGRTPVEN